MNQTCNGWPNAETWRVQLHLANDERLAEYVAGVAFLYVTGFTTCPAVRDMYEASTFAEWLRVYVHHRTNADGVGGTTFEMLARDFVEASLARVDWDRLAEHWLDAGRHDARERGVAVDGAAEATA